MSVSAPGFGDLRFPYLRSIIDNVRRRADRRVDFRHKPFADPDGLGFLMAFQESTIFPPP
jgi:hypothetical protein